MEEMEQVANFKNAYVLPTLALHTKYTLSKVQDLVQSYEDTEKELLGEKEETRAHGDESILSMVGEVSVLRVNIYASLNFV